MSDTPSRAGGGTSAGRVLSFVAAGVLAFIALGFTAAGGVLLWGDSQKDSEGRLSTSEHRFGSAGYAVATDDLDIDLDGVGELLDRDLLGRVHVTAESRTGKPVFVGIARSRDVDAYLRDSAHSTVMDVELDPFAVDYRAQGGDRRPASPAAQDFWAASTQGRGARTTSWEVRDGSWSIVVMHADGSRGVDAGVAVGATAPLLAPIGWGALGAGLLLFGAAAGIAYAAARAGRREATVEPRRAVAA